MPTGEPSPFGMSTQPEVKESGTLLTAPALDAPQEPPAMLLVGLTSGTHVGASLRRAAVELGVAAQIIDADAAYRAPRWWRAAAWRLDRRPVRLSTFSADIVEAADHVY